MKSICVITSVHPVLDKRVFNREILSLKKFGYEVDLIAPLSEKHKVIQGVNIYGIPRKSKLFRFINWIKILRLALRKPYSAYHFHDPDLLCVGSIIRCLTGKPVIYDVHEHFAEGAVLFSGLPNFLNVFIRLLFRVFEEICVKIIKNVVVVEDSMQDRYLPLGANVLLLYNYAKKEMFMSDVEWGQKEKIIVHTGGLAKNRGAKILVQVAEIVVSKYPDWEFVIVEQYYTEKQKLEFRERLRHANLGHSVLLCPPVLPSEMKTLLMKASIGLSFLPLKGQFNKAIPTKFFEYMACEMVIVASDLYYSRKYIGENNVGILCSPSDPQAYADAIIKLIENPALREEMGKKARQVFLSKYNWEREEIKLRDYYAKLLQG